MLVYVVCAEVPYDSYHQVVLATLDKEQAERTVSEQNVKHEPGCRTQRETESDWDECFCKQYHKHEMTLDGWTDYRRLGDMSVSSIRYADLTTGRPVC